MNDVVPPELLESLSHLLQKVARCDLRHLSVAPQVVPQISTSTELQHQVQAVGILHRDMKGKVHKLMLLVVGLGGALRSTILSCCCV